MGRPHGQHFLSDPSILERIVDALEPQREDVVLEIGAGKGSLTRPLAARVKRVIAIERDGRLAEQLRAAGQPPNVELIEGDALTLDWARLLGGPSVEFKLAGNIPYHITSPLLARALTPPAATTIVFLVQREVADRLAANPGSKSYGALTVGVQAVAAVERLFIVRAGAFQPPPQVHSAVVRLRPHVRPLVAPEERAAFRRFVVALFGQRRKQVRRALKTVSGAATDEIRRVLAALDIDPRARCETLPPALMERLFRTLGGSQ